MITKLFEFLTKNTQTIDNILGDITNLQLVIFGVVVTIFTVIYSFIVNKRDELRNYSELIKTGKASANDYKKSTFGAAYINRLKDVNSHLIKLIILTALIYFVSYITKNFLTNEEFKSGLFMFTGLASMGTILYIGIVLFSVIKYYNKQTKI